MTLDKNKNLWVAHFRGACVSVFNSRGKLNMQMGLNEFSAEDVINKLGKKALIPFAIFIAFSTASAPLLTRKVFVFCFKTKTPKLCVIKTSLKSVPKHSSKKHL